MKDPHKIIMSRRCKCGQVFYLPETRLEQTWCEPCRQELIHWSRPQPMEPTEPCSPRRCPDGFRSENVSWVDESFWSFRGVPPG